MNNIKDEIEKIAIPKNLHERSKLGVEKAKSEKKKRNFKNPLVAAAAVSVLGFGLLLTPQGQATFGGLFQVSEFEERANVKEMSFGWGVENVPLYGEQKFESFNEFEEQFNISVPFPQQLLEIEETGSFEDFDLKVDLNESNQFSAFSYHISTTERSYSVYATNHDEAAVQFSAETADGSAIEKDVSINGVDAKLLGTKEIDGYAMYVENEGWKLIVFTSDRASNLEGDSDVTEEELTSIIESIEW